MAKQSLLMIVENFFITSFVVINILEKSFGMNKVTVFIVQGLHENDKNNKCQKITNKDFQTKF